MINLRRGTRPDWARGSVTLVLILSGCLNAPITGRKQFVAIPEQEEVRLGAEAWESVQSRESPTQSTHYSEVVQRVGNRIAAVAGRPDYQWEFRVFASQQPNAFALPGGKVAVYEGLLPICQNEAGLAVVMSHEIAHVLARHGGERMSQQAAAQAGGGLLGKALGGRSATQQERWLGAYGVASRVGVLLPYSRTHESEADSIRLTLMAQAGYDPSEAPRFWERFARVSGKQPPEFLSTHPADSRRAEHLRGLLPQALAVYQAAPDKLGTGMAIAAPPPGVARDNAVQLASHTDVQPVGGVAPATFETVDIDEFLPPLQRVRSPADTSTVAVTTEPVAPFPDSAAPPISDSGWVPATH